MTKAATTFHKKWFVVRVRPGGSREAPDRIIAHGALKGMPYEPARQGETKIERSLRDEGYFCYFPKMRKEIIHHRTKKRITRAFPLFVGYVFVSLASKAMDFRTLRDLDFVGPVVKVGEVPIPVSDQFVAGLMADQIDMQFDDTEQARIHRGEQARTSKEELRRRFRKGSGIKVKEGPFAGFHGHVISTKGKDRVQAMIELFGRETAVEFEAQQVETVAKRIAIG